MVKQPRQMQKLWSMRGCGSRILFRREDMNYTTSIIWMKLGFTMGTLYYLSFPIIKLILGYCRMAPDRGLSDHRQAGVKGNKNWLTHMITSHGFIIDSPSDARTLRRLIAHPTSADVEIPMYLLAHPMSDQKSATSDVFDSSSDVGLKVAASDQVLATSRRMRLRRGG